jgi:hypothetical protein
VACCLLIQTRSTAAVVALQPPAEEAAKAVARLLTAALAPVNDDSLMPEWAPNSR